MSARPAYFDRYKTICFDRTASGILTIRLHSNDGPVVYGSAHHNDWVHAFFDISADRDNKVLIITGTGDEFIATERWDKPYDKVEHWDQIYWEGKRVLQNLLDIEIPVIGAINGPAHVHAEIGILAGPGACRQSPPDRRRGCRGTQGQAARLRIDHRATGQGSLGVGLHLPRV